MAQRNLIPDRELPIYSIIVALYREAATVGGLVESLNAINYPPEKLNIILALEPDDRETWHAIAKLELDPTFTVVLAPRAGPRTKPKALNAALAFARGSYVAVFDAEDRPEPDQLKKALQAFRAGDRKLACVQARLTIDNSAETWITGMFAAEYAGLFDVFLPGIAAWRLPLPLGGTSNHFRMSTLREAGAWDPYNVTEDADLGMRLARLGYHTSVINSTTYEEAPSRLNPWLKQRTRWFKGWMQTWLVHMRYPARLWRDLGSSGFLVFQSVIGGTVLTAMVHGVFAVALGWQIAMGWLWAEKSSLADMVFAGLHLMTLVTGYAISGLLGILGLARRRMMFCAWTLWLMPVYWLLLSVAAWRALFDLILEPYAWDKTEHALARQAAPPREIL
jgi:cellulose synthase/poly-beta-1,6-N-acetylglucosamine synthase-like glycosyltransferase